MRFFRFLTVGGLAAVVQFLTLAGWKTVAGPTLAFTLSFACSTTTHYLLNRGWALPSSRADRGRQAGEYLLTVGISYVINLAVFTAAHALLGLDTMWSAVAALPPATVVVFLLLNYRVFRR